MWSIHTIEYYSAIQRNKLLRHANNWDEFQGIMVSKKKKPVSKKRQDKITEFKEYVGKMYD